MTTNLKNANYKLETYRTLCAMTTISVARPRVGRWNYELIFDVVATEEGVDGRGSRGSGTAEAAVISNPPHRIEYGPEVEIGGTILTHFGTFRVGWLREFGSVNYDHLVLVPV